MCIPTNDPKSKIKIKATDPLPGLKGFDSKSYQYDDVKVDDDGTKHYYKNGKEFKIMANTGTQMGIISNLITDMTLGGANDAELAAAVRHSMVVIDAEKHKLDYKQSAIDNNIAALHKKYQGRTTGGAATIISRAKGRYEAVKRQGTPKINQKGKDWYDPNKPEGALIYKEADDAHYEVTKVDKRTGETTTVTKTRTFRSTKMGETDDAYTLVSDAKHPMELLYADYANSMKALANKARMEMVKTGKVEYKASAKAAYANEVAELDRKLNIALLNTTKEREAQRRANAEIRSKKAAAESDGEKMSTGDIKKASQQALSKYRNEVDSVSRRNRAIQITDREWEAIQAGAISENKLLKILNNADIDSLRERATPRATTTLSPSKISRAKALSASNYTLAEIAKKLGVSTSTVSKYLKGVN
jgi:DNA-binding CsgD family transcriptional regulator